MAIDFHSKDNRSSYSSRDADSSWIQKINEICDVNGKSVLDIGCGGGIYTKALADMGALTVTALDFSEQMLSTAKGNCKGYPNIRYQLGNALDTKLEDNQFDMILERAVIHHISDLDTCFREAYRILKPGGIYLIQDRTPEDCLLKGDLENIRGYFFEKYPSLIEKEVSRRHSEEKVLQSLQKIGFQDTNQYQLWETRKIYNTQEELSADILRRTGRSILHELNDTQIQDLVNYINSQLIIKNNEPIVEKDKWTIWKAAKPL
ncbi:class I SAM-dependent methyltransferase [Rummeliibacillus pycnus]|uniref:class I SAM-dependent methyltransferase n=1 Tax=Rummeliibacillus pycnus TaxID=101070 RepID=UPI003D2E7B47